MIAFFDTREKVDFLINFATTLCGENMEDYIFLSFVPAFRKSLYRNEILLCLNFKHRLSKDVVHIALSLTQMEATFGEGEVEPFVWKNDGSFPKGSFLIYFDYWKNLVLEIHNFNFPSAWSNCPRKYMLAYALFALSPELFQTCLRKKYLLPALYDKYFGYYLEISEEKGVFMRVEHSFSENPFVFLGNRDNLRIFFTEPWRMPLLQPANKRFWYFNGVKFICRVGLYVTETETQALLKERGIDEYTSPYRHPLPVCLQNNRYWLVASKTSAKQKNLLLVELFSGAFREVSYKFFCKYGTLALADDNAFFG